ncbi:phosphate acyltransferase PlsX [Rhodobacteraceae bacterium WD3A24]|nr:phosphate acyltransferase PlsX [Rhodobacteraceae bacterium WD3A24]
MTTPSAQTDRPDRGHIIISVDAMGGDLGPEVVIEGMVKSAVRNRAIAFIVHGDEAQIAPLVARRSELAGRCEIRHAPAAVSMTDKPSQAVRNGDDTSMWSALESVRSGEATVAVSCGNTGALMLLSMVRLRKLPGVNRPAIAVLWPSRNPGGHNLMLDAGADIRAEADDLVQYAAMGAAYARDGLHLSRPRVGLLNVGVEDHKGRAELKAAHEKIAAAAETGDFEFVGFVEGGDITSDRLDVVVTDGFTGNVALKTAEGVAGLIRELMRESFSKTPLSRLAALFALPALKRLQKRVDPRRVNGGVFLGLNGTVIKSHGSADATGVSAAIKLAFKLAESGFQTRLAALLASAQASGQDAGADRNSDGGQE